MKKIFALLLMVMMAVGSVWGQEIVFHKFALKKNGYVKVVKDLWTSFTASGDVQLKYVRVQWYAVNPVGDAIDGQVSALDQNGTNIYLKGSRIVGPITMNKKRYCTFGHSVITNLDVTAIPKYVTLTYMDGTEKIIEITRDNYATYFPKLKWMDYTAPAEE